MSSTDLNAFFHRPCRFKLRSGKEVFGVIWLDSDQLLFASIDAYKKYAENHLSDDERSRLTYLSKKEILGVELIPAMAS